MEYFSTRGSGARISASEAIAQGLAPDGGLFVPAQLPPVTEEALRSHIDAACARIGDEAFLSGGVERLRQVERRNSETARMLLER